MSVVSAISLPSEVFVVADSRASFSSSARPPEDALRKIFLLGPRFAVAYTSGNVFLTLNMISGVERYLKQEAVTEENQLMNIVPKKMKKEYDRLSAKYGLTDSMEFIYATTDLVNRKKVLFKPIFELMQKNQGSFSVPPEIYRAMREMSDGEILLYPPIPLVLSQTFPGGGLRDHPVYGVVTSGSGKDVINNIDEEFHRLFSYETRLRIPIIQSIHEDYFVSSGVESIGGLVQMVQISYGDANLIQHTQYSVSEKGGLKRKYDVEFKEGYWVEKDYENGRENKVESNPLSWDLSADDVAPDKGTYSDYD